VTGVRRVLFRSHLVSQTRPDLKFSVNQLSRRAKCPTSRDCKALRRLLFYADQTKHLGLTFCSYGQPFELFVTADSSFNCYSDSKSHTGVTVHLGQFAGAVMSFCGKQSIIADSSTVAEFIGAHQACKIIAWVQNLASQTRPDLKFPTSRDYKAVQCLLFYVDQIKHMGFTFCSYGQPFELFVTADSSFNCYSDSKSHMGVTLFIWDNYLELFCLSVLNNRLLQILQL
jgi:hypothetical protein